MTQNKKRSGFITLFFILGISFTFLTWISLSSSRIFEYITIKKTFVENRALLQNHIACADSFIDNFINSKYNLDIVEGSLDFNRSLYFVDNYQCHITSINITFADNSLSRVFFISGDFAFEYEFKNGFINHIKSFRLF